MSGVRCTASFEATRPAEYVGDTTAVEARAVHARGSQQGIGSSKDMICCEDAPAISLATSTDSVFFGCLHRKVIDGTLTQL